MQCCAQKFDFIHSQLSFSFDHTLGLDYTNDYDGNKSPDESNYELLAELYGTVGGNSTSTTAAQPGARRIMKHLRQPASHRHLFQSVQSEPRRQELLSNWNEIVSQAESGLVGSETNGWRLLHQTPFGEAHEIDLGDNFSVQIHYLLHKPE